MQLLTMGPLSCNPGRRLNKLEVKNAWLSVEGLIAMPSLTCLTLEFVRLEDENLSKLNEVFPCLKQLNLLGVGGFKEPQLHNQHLKYCQWIVSDAPLSVTIVAPKMARLNLKCVRPRSLVLETPLLSDLHLTLEKADMLYIGELRHLQKFRLVSGNLCDLIYSFPHTRAVKELSLDSVKQNKQAEAANPYLDLIFDVFPNICTLNLGPGAYTDMEASFGIGKLRGRIGMEHLKDFTAHLVIHDIDVTLSFIFWTINKCSNLSAVSLLIHHELDPVIASSFISRCVADCSRVRWKWGFWKEDSEDVWVSDATSYLHIRCDVDT